MLEKYFVYILECQDGSFYTGIAKDLEKRMQEHKTGKGSKYVRLKGFKKLLKFRECRDKSEALKLEYKIKKMPKFDKLKFLKKNQ